MHREKLLGYIGTYTLLLFLVVLTILPLFWMVATSLKDETKVMAFPPQFIPDPIKFENYSQAFTSAPFHLYFWNSFKITILVAVGVIIVSSLGGYAFARFEFPLQGVFFIILLSGMMIPQAMMLVPLYSMFRVFGWLDSHISLIIPPILANTFITFLFRQFFKAIPISLDESAIIDGCSPFAIYWRIMMPLSKPAIATAAVFSFMGNWNAFVRPLIFIHSEDKFTVTLGLSVFQGQFTTDYHLTMAVATMGLIPIIGVFLAAQKYFISGFVTSGMKS